MGIFASLTNGLHPFLFTPFSFSNPFPGGSYVLTRHGKKWATNWIRRVGGETMRLMASGNRWRVELMTWTLNLNGCSSNFISFPWRMVCRVWLNIVCGPHLAHWSHSNGMMSKFPPFLCLWWIFCPAAIFRRRKVSCSPDEVYRFFYNNNIFQKTASNSCILELILVELDASVQNWKKWHQCNFIARIDTFCTHIESHKIYRVSFVFHSNAEVSAIVCWKELLPGMWTIIMAEHE